MNFIRYYIAIFVAAFLLSCSDSGCNVIPNQSFRTNINRAEHLNVYTTNGWVYADGGVCGLIVYNAGSDNLIAYDRCSTVDSKSNNRVRVDGFVVIDDESGAKWLIKDGSPMELAECPLKPYHVGKVGDSYVVQN